MVRLCLKRDGGAEDMRECIDESTSLCSVPLCTLLTLTYDADVEGSHDVGLLGQLGGKWITLQEIMGDIIGAS